MTNEEAIFFMTLYKQRLEASISNGMDKDIEAFDTAIKALEQELCEDAVSRKAVINTLDNMDKALDTDRTVESYKELLTECYKVLPSVTPKEKTAKWYGVDGCEGACEGYMSAGVICSQCGEVLCGYIGDYDFCPNCGARMVSE